MVGRQGGGGDRVEQFGGIAVAIRGQPRIDVCAPVARPGHSSCGEEEDEQARDGPGDRMRVAPENAPGRRSANAENAAGPLARPRSEEHTSELQSLMRISYAVSRLKKQK